MNLGQLTGSDNITSQNFMPVGNETFTPVNESIYSVNPTTQLVGINSSNGITQHNTNLPNMLPSNSFGSFNVPVSNISGYDSSLGMNYVPPYPSQWYSTQRNIPGMVCNPHAMYDQNYINQMHNYAMRQPISRPMPNYYNMGNPAYYYQMAPQMPQIPQMQPIFNIDASNIESEMKSLKETLKTGENFTASCIKLRAMIPLYLDGNTKRLFYDALMIIKNRALSNNNLARIAQSVFDVAMAYQQNFTQGFLRNIVQWRSEVASVAVSFPVQMVSQNQIPRMNVPIPMHVGYQGPPRTDNVYSQPSYTGTEKKYAAGASILNYPYYETIKKLTKDTKLKVSNTGLWNLTFNVVLNQDIHEKISDNNSIYQVKLCCVENSNRNKCLKIPQKLRVIINDKDLVEKSKRVTAYDQAFGSDISNLCVLGNNTIHIQSWIPTTELVFFIQVTKTISIEELEQEQKNRKLSYEEGLKRAIKSFGDDDDIMAVSLKLSLRCPLTLLKIENPVRGRNCSHLQCFELSAYLQMNKNHPTFLCPVCSKFASYSSLIIDEYIQKILESTGEDIEEVVIEKDGTWNEVPPEDISFDEDEEDSFERALKRKWEEQTEMNKRQRIM
eukprot:TRINITY_DN359_c0_g1_i1.p1 TRINITY_DN359_c0_g1~~TRINITY_DN359_c0_g1_i1.p1  ORF type:complete len:640 (-),score=124.66 TRINITY_DN359_c0_g1_i1:1500-3332(-)